MADEPWEKPVKELKSSIAKAQKDIDHTDRRIDSMNNSLDVAINDAREAYEKPLADVAKRLDKDIDDIQKQLKDLKGRVP
jgi:peptidoglycan hydrolase CwlO-like protein